MAYIPPTSHVTLLATLRRERLLPVPGDVLVAEQQRVEANTVVASAIMAEKHHLLYVAEELGVPEDKADQYFRKQPGEPVKQGDLIAQRSAMFGLVRASVTSPVEGELLMTGAGKALLASFSKPVELRAGMPGMVTGVLAGRGVTVETTGALLSGIWGNGRDDFAVTRVVGSSPNAPLLSEQLDMGLRGVVVVAGRLESTEPIKQIEETRLRGLILGSVRTELLPALRKLDIPVVVVDGFGTDGFSPAAYGLLVSNNGREVWVNGQTWDRFTGNRPEVIIPLPSPGQAPMPLIEGDQLRPSKRVRIVRGEHAGRSGTVVNVSARTLIAPGGFRTRVAQVEFEQLHEEPVFVPFANVEIID